MSPVEPEESHNEAAAIHVRPDAATGRNDYNFNRYDYDPFQTSDFKDFNDFNVSQSTQSTNFFSPLATIGQGKSTLFAAVNGFPVRALVDTGSIENYIDAKLSSNLQLKLIPKHGQVCLANGSVITTPGYVIVNMTVNNVSYNNVKLGILPDAIADAILGCEFQRQHSKVVFNYGGDRPPLVCAFSTINAEPPELFPNLSAECHPIAAKSRRYSYADREFIRGEVVERRHYSEK